MYALHTLMTPLRCSFIIKIAKSTATILMRTHVIRHCSSASVLRNIRAMPWILRVCEYAQYSRIKFSPAAKCRSNKNSWPAGNRDLPRGPHLHKEWSWIQLPQGSSSLSLMCIFHGWMCAYACAHWRNENRRWTNKIKESYFAARFVSLVHIACMCASVYAIVFVIQKYHELFETIIPQTLSLSRSPLVLLLLKTRIFHFINLLYSILYNSFFPLHRS